MNFKKITIANLNLENLKAHHFIDDDNWTCNNTDCDGCWEGNTIQDTYGDR